LGGSLRYLKFHLALQGNQLQSECNKSLAHANPSERHALIGIQCSFLSDFYGKKNTSFFKLEIIQILDLMFGCARKIKLKYLKTKQYFFKFL